MMSKACRYASRKAVLPPDLSTLPTVSKVAKVLNLSWEDAIMLLRNYTYGYEIGCAMDEQILSSEHACTVATNRDELSGSR